MRKKIYLLAIPAGLAIGAAAFLLKKKSAGTNSPVSKANSKSSGRAAPEIRNPKTGSYSFISGFQNAVTVELQLDYDADRFFFAVHEDEFLTESGDSHVAVLSGEDYSAQFEYGSYYRGEDYTKFRTELAAKHADLADAVYGDNRGLQYLAGDNICLVFPIPEDNSSYLLVTLVKAKGNDDPITALPAYADVNAQLSSIRFTRS